MVKCNRSMNRARGPIRCLVSGLLFCVLFTTVARAETVVARVPVYLDYPLLNHLLVTQLFSPTDRSRELLNDPSGCSRVLLTDPLMGPNEDNLEIGARVDAGLGLDVLGSCRSLIDWKGSVRLVVRPVLQPDGRSVRLEPRETLLFDTTGKRILSGPVWDAANSQLRQLVRGFLLDLTPYFEALSALLPEVLPQVSGGQLQAMVESLTLGSLDVQPESLDLGIQFAVDVPDPAEEPAIELSSEELARFEERWQMMDALLVGAIKQYASATSLSSLRTTLLEILLDSRYRLRDALAGETGQAGDEVRHLFIESWQRLGPVVRQVALEQSGQEHWLWLSVLTATDALAALDQMGPALGLDISTDGLRRLARMINAEKPENLLLYSEEVDPQLQQLWHEGNQFQAPEPEASIFNLFLFPSAHASTPAEKLKGWVPGRKDLDTYLPLVDSLLQETSGKVLQQNKLDSGYATLYEKLVVATAWQESCWRQYTVLKKRVEPLRSGSGDVGLMQVNEKVWRGFYDINKLRWDVDYNTGAGAEILFNYMTRYALRKGEHKQQGGLVNLARASYSAYNGGPSQVSRYRRTDVPAAHRKIDRLFWEKYQQVDSGKSLNVAFCLGGEPPKNVARATTPTVTKAPAPTTSKSSTSASRNDNGNDWLKAQPSSRYTLQLATFSTRDSAARFVREQSLNGKAQVCPLPKGRETMFVVLHGNYASRAAADPDKRKFQKLKPWLRQFQDLQK